MGDEMGAQIKISNMKNLFVLILLCFSLNSMAQLELRAEVGYHHWTEHLKYAGDINYDFQTTTIRYRPDMSEIPDIFVEAAVQYMMGSYGEFNAEITLNLRVPKIQIPNGPGIRLLIVGAGFNYDSWMGTADFKMLVMTEIDYKKFYIRASVNSRLIEAHLYSAYLYWDIGAGYKIFN